MTSLDMQTRIHLVEELFGHLKQKKQSVKIYDI